MRRTLNASRSLAACLPALALLVLSPEILSRGVRAREAQVTLAGCLVRGEGSDAGYLITNTSSEPASARAEDTRLSPNAFGAVGGFTTVAYWLEDDGNLKPHVGHRVEVDGDLKGEPRDGEMAVERKDKWTEVTLKVDGRTLRASVPHTSVEAAPDRKGADKREVFVRRVAVEHVRMLDAACAP